MKLRGSSDISRSPAATRRGPVLRASVPKRGILGPVIALLAPIMIAARCSEPEAAAPPVAASMPIAPVAASPLTTAPAPTEPPKTTSAARGDVCAFETPMDGWFRIERLCPDVEGGWVSGHDYTPNRIVIETHNVSQFSMDVSQLNLDWSKRVWVRINSTAFELIHKRNPVIHLRETSAGVWEIVKPHEE